MVELTLKKRAKLDKETGKLMVEIPQEIVDGFVIRSGDEVEWTYFINCKNQKKVGFVKKYKGF